MSKAHHFKGSHHYIKDFKSYEKLHQHSIENPEAFWGEMGKTLTWFKPYTKVMNADFSGNHEIKWYEDGELNACYNCIDRHLPHKKEQTAITWEANNPEVAEKISYQKLYDKVNRFANGLKSIGVKKGDKVIIYMPMIPEAAYAMLACARIGAVHSVVFGGFSPEALASRIDDCEAHFIITANEALRGTKSVALKSNVDKALKLTNKIKHCVVVKSNDNPFNLEDKRDILYSDLIKNQNTDCPPEPMNAEDPLFILYTSGSTGKPKGVLHTTGGYLVYSALTFAINFDYQDGELFWCTADVGWITGHSYSLYGPLLNGGNTLFFEGVPNYPSPARFWEICDKHQVNIFYTAPTAIRSLMTEGPKFVKNHDLSSLRILGSVGEPINEEAWEWYNENVGKDNCPIVDTWWQTETGGHLIAPIPYLWDQIPGKATLPFLGIEPKLLDDKGNEITTPNTEGVLAFSRAWPGMMRTVYGDHQRFINTYFNAFPGYYFPGDGALVDEQGYFRITGRVDDVLNISGHRMGTAEIEDAFDLHAKVSEAAVVGFPHSIKGQGIYVFATLYKGEKPSDALKKELVQWIREKIGPVATPDVIQFSDDLPKTRSGKIMRRILRKIAENEVDSLGDISTLANPDIVESLVNNREVIE